MHQLLSSSILNCDYDLDQPWFFSADEEEQNFYPEAEPARGPASCCSALSEDIWKKFELVPTRSHTPNTTPTSSPATGDSLRDEAVTRSFIWGMDWVPDTDPAASLRSDLDWVPDTDPAASFKSMVVRDDCMWSSFSAMERLEKVVSERWASLQAKRSSSSSGCGREAAGESVSFAQVPDPDHLPEDCVDPCEVFSIGLCEDQDAAVPSVDPHSPPHSHTQPEEEEEEENEDEEDDDDDDDEEEEVDVVTVNQGTASLRGSGSSGAHCHGHVERKRAHINIQQHNYAAPAPSSSSSLSSSSTKRARYERDEQQNDNSISCSELDRRRSHNVQERQRRDELKLSFLLLRRQIPELSDDNNKASKVVVLKRAQQCILGMQADERRLTALEAQLRRKGEELRHRLEELRRGSGKLRKH